MAEQLPVCFGRLPEQADGGHEPAGMTKVSSGGFGTVYQCTDCDTTIRHPYRKGD